MHNVTQQVREYFALISDGTPSVPLCEGCGVRFLPPRALCPACGGDRLGWYDATGATGTIYSLTRMPGGKTIALAELECVDGGGRLFAEVVGPDAAEAQIGDAVMLDVAEAETELGSRVPVLRRGASL